ncbi:hypothetical protein S245_017988, partial [Arachis hypogaea]
VPASASPVSAQPRRRCPRRNHRKDNVRGTQFKESPLLLLSSSDFVVVITVCVT